MPATYEPIATTTLGSASNNITFSSIPSTYTDLKIILICSAASASNPGLQFNADTGSNYSGRFISGTGSAANSTATASLSYIYLQSQQAMSTTVPSGVIVDVFSYTGSAKKSCLITTFTDLNGSGAVEQGIGLWQGTNAITSIKLFPIGGANFNTGTSATLYGIKGA